MTLTQAALRSVLRYDADTGEFSWLETGKGRHTEVGAVSGNGYRQVTVAGRKYQAHRLAYLYMFGEWPAGDVDHINGDRLDNRIANLRAATRSENMQNQHVLQRRNTSGHLGVRWNERSLRWNAKIGLNGQSHYIGSFTDLADAISARKSAEMVMHTKPVQEFA